jgi:hypothetical protein
LQAPPEQSKTSDLTSTPTQDLLKLGDVSSVEFKRLEIEERELRDLIESGESDDDDAIRRYSNMSGFR